MRFGRAADRRAMAAATTLATASPIPEGPEPAWASVDFEALSEDEVVDLLLRRLRKLIALGVEPGLALIGASRLEIALP